MMTPDDRRARRQRQQKLERAFEILKQQPDFPRAQVQAHDRGEDLAKNLSPQQIALGTPERMNVVLRVLDIQAEAYLELVVDMKTQDAFMVALEAFGRKAFENFTGFPLEVVKGTAGNELEAIQQRVRHWVNAGYRKLIPPDSSGMSECIPEAALGDQEDVQRQPTGSTIAASDTTLSQRRRIFLCHASEDKDKVRDLYRLLYADGYFPWLDEEDILPGQDWDHEIRNAVKSCEVVIVCLSHCEIG